MELFNLNEEEKEEFVKEFEAALNLKNYNLKKDLEASTPWCCPWTWAGKNFPKFSAEDVETLAKTFAEYVKLDIVGELIDRNLY